MCTSKRPNRIGRSTTGLPKSPKTTRMPPNRCCAMNSKPSFATASTRKGWKPSSIPSCAIWATGRNNRACGYRASTAAASRTSRKCSAICGPISLFRAEPPCADSRSCRHKCPTHSEKPPPPASATEGCMRQPASSVPAPATTCVWRCWASFSSQRDYPRRMRTRGSSCGSGRRSAQGG